MKVILGLGNPGREYAATRHNAGWWFLDHLAHAWGLGGWRRDHDARVAAGIVDGVQLRLIEPQTFMNLSGDALRPYTRRPFWAAPTDLLVVVDDVALPVGRFRFRARGSAGGHNGLKHVEHTLRTNEYARLRIGVGPPDDTRQLPPDLADYVLAPAGKHERAEVEALFPTLTDACATWLRDGIERTMNTFNTR